MNRSNFLKLFVLTPVVFILGCEVSTNHEQQTLNKMSKTITKGAGKMIVSYKVVDKEGNIKTVVTDKELKQQPINQVKK